MITLAVLLSQHRVVLRPSNCCQNEHLPLPSLILILPFTTGTPRGASPLVFFSSTGITFLGVEGLTTEKQGHKRGCRGVDHMHRSNPAPRKPSASVSDGHWTSTSTHGRASLPCASGRHWLSGITDGKGKRLSRNCT